MQNFCHSSHYSTNTCLPVLHFSVFFEGSLVSAANINLGPQGASLTNPPFGPHLFHISNPPLFSVERIQGEDLRDLGLSGVSSSPNPTLESTIFACSSSPDPRCVPIHCLTVIRDQRGAHCTVEQGAAGGASCRG